MMDLKDCIVIYTGPYNNYTVFGGGGGGERGSKNPSERTSEENWEGADRPSGGGSGRGVSRGNFCIWSPPKICADARKTSLTGVQK